MFKFGVKFAAWYFLPIHQLFQRSAISAGSWVARKKRHERPPLLCLKLSLIVRENSSFVIVYPTCCTFNRLRYTEFRGLN